MEDLVALAKAEEASNLILVSIDDSLAEKDKNARHLESTRRKAMYMLCPFWASAPMSPFSHLHFEILGVATFTLSLVSIYTVDWHWPLKALHSYLSYLLYLNRFFYQIIGSLTYQYLPWLCFLL